MKMLTTTLVNEISANRRVKPKTRIKAKQQLLSKEVFSPIITHFKRERFIPLYKNETW